jgi:hypothetical protein
MSVRYCRYVYARVSLLVFTCGFRESVVDKLQESCDEWRAAAAAKDTAKLHSIANLWLGLEITPAEFRRIHKLGHVSMPSSVERLKDDSLNEKLDKVCL